jgi:ABC-type multidrug transport system permease subunit
MFDILWYIVGFALLSMVVISGLVIVFQKDEDHV